MVLSWMEAVRNPGVQAVCSRTCLQTTLRMCSADNRLLLQETKAGENRRTAGSALADWIPV
ncbi:MAG: hypothetical protein K2P48_12165 [Lachnospiraceae bacterium]|nr:hypothetical protein [Lachnospiraceae bacterium]